MPIANAVTAMLLGAAMAAAQAPTSFPGWTLNGSAIMEETPGGGLRLLLTPNQAGQAGSAFVTKPISFHAGNTFSYNLDYARSLPFGARSAITKCLPNSAQPSLTSA
jgi:hypothetical protein